MRAFVALGSVFSIASREIGLGKVGWLEFNVPYQHKYGYIRDEIGLGKPNQEIGRGTSPK